MTKKTKLLEAIDQKTDLIKTVLMVKDSEGVRAAEAYEGLRKTVIDAREARRLHEVHLARMDAAIQRGANFILFQSAEFVLLNSLRHLVEGRSG